MRRTEMSRKPKPKLCKWCKETFTPTKMGQEVCKPFPCAIELGKHKEAKKREKASREQKRRDKQRLEQMKGLAEHVRDTQKLVNKVVVLEDRPKGCISCGSMEVTDSGHYFHRGSKYRVSPLTLDRKNLNGQCRHCNSYKGGGNQHEYRIGMIERYGQKRFDDLCEMKEGVDRGEIPKLTIEECKEIQKWAKSRIKELT